MSTALRSYFSGHRVRYIDNEFNLDLTYITDRIMAMGYPSTKFESFYRNNIVDVSRMLNRNHGKHYLIFNLSDRDYDYSAFDNRVIVCGFADHHSPPIALMWAIYSFIDLWMAVSPENVIAAHCLAGKGRTGIVICCTLLMQGFFNKLNANTTTEYVNAAVNYFHEKRGDGVENPDQIKFIRDFLVSSDTIGADNSLQFDLKLQPSLYVGSLILYNVPVGIGDAVNLSLVVYLKSRNEWNVVYNSAWNYYPLPKFNHYQREIVIDINTPARGDLLFMLKNEKKEVLHFSINTTQVPCCTPYDLTSLYFYKNNISIAKSSNLPFTDSFAVQLICLDHTYFNKSTRNERLTVLHAISKQAIEEERSRRLALLRLHDSDENRIVSSIQYQDLLNMDLNMFHSPHPTPEPGVMTPVNLHTHFDFSVSPIQSNPNSPQRDNNQTLQSESFHSGPHNEFETLPPSPPPHPPHPRFNSAGEVSIPPDNDTGVTVTVRPRNKANPGNDRFAQRIPFLKQISLSFGGDYCQQANDLSLELPPPKIKGKRRDLTLHEKEVFSKEDIAFALCGMEDQEIRIMSSYCDLYATQQEKDETTAMETPLQVVLNTPFPTYYKSKQNQEYSEFCEYYEEIPPQIIIMKMFAQVYDKRVWKRRLLIITTSMVLVMKRPDDHYLKNVFVLKDMKKAIAVIPKKENESWTVLFASKNSDIPATSIQFDNFNDLMYFIALTRRFSGYQDCLIQYPPDCEDPGLFKDIASLLYLYYPDRINGVVSVYNTCVHNPERYEQWVLQQFGLSVSFCRNIFIVNKVEEVEELITQDNEILSSEIYLKPKYIEVREIPPSVTAVVKEFQALLDNDIYIRLVQVCQFVYPSPLPLVRAILDLYNEEWAKLFDQNPYAFLRAIRESNAYCKQSYTNRSYRKPKITSQRMNVMPSVIEEHE